MCLQWCMFRVTTVVLLSLLAMLKHSEGRGAFVIMYPNEDDQVFDAETALNLTCIQDGVNHFSGTPYNISWTLPEHLVKNSIAMRHNGISHRLQNSFDGNKTHLWTTMTLSYTKAVDTGYYSCISIFVPSNIIDFNRKKYVYIFDGRQNVIKIEREAYSMQIGESLTLPCVVTHPNVTISLVRRTDSKISSINLLIEGNSRWFIEPKKGLTLNGITLDDRGKYACVGTMKNTNPNHVEFSIEVSGMELTKVEGPEDPLEGTNVTLLCRNKDSNNESSLDWYQINREFGKPNLLNATDLPEGMKINKKWEANILEVNLTIFEVPLSAITQFKCSTRDNRYSKVISFRVKEITNDTVSVQLKNGEPENLTCIRPSEKHTIQWRKDEKLYSGYVESDRINSSVLLLQGTVDEIGIYSCHWTNSLGEARFKMFNVNHVDKPAPKSSDAVTIAVSVTLAILLLISIIVGVQMYLKKKQEILRAEELLKGNFKNLNPNLTVEEQSEQLPYDKRWEFPRNRLKLGSQLGAGCFGVVVKAKAIGINGSDEISKTVAVKMVRSKTNVAALEDLICELKVLIYLGSHLNVLNLLGACTTKIHKGELFIIVEYCRFGNLQKILIKNRNNFINQVDELGNIKRDAITEDETENLPVIQQVAETSVSSVQDSEGYLVPNCSIDELNQIEPTTETETHQSISTKNLVSWSFQIARGMGYLSRKKVIHGDLAARNVLLADNGVVKVADFGMARKMYYEENYKKNGQSLMPIKWMAPESLTDRILSTESDVWAYGILLWEFFSLGKVPYPDIDTKELIKELENGYRMEKPNYAPNFIGDVMEHCWKKEPKDRPSFRQLEEMITPNLESSVSSYYSNLNAPYEKFNEEKAVAPKTERFGLAKMFNEKSKLMRSQSHEPVGYSLRYSRPPVAN